MYIIIIYLISLILLSSIQSASVDTNLCSVIVEKVPCNSYCLEINFYNHFDSKLFNQWGKQKEMIGVFKLKEKKICFKDQLTDQNMVEALLETIQNNVLPLDRLCIKAPNKILRQNFFYELSLKSEKGLAFVVDNEKDLKELFLNIDSDHLLFTQEFYHEYEKCWQGLYHSEKYRLINILVH